MDEYFLFAVIATGPGGTERAGAGGRPLCGLYEECIAPLCPLDRSSLKGVWYPGEEICRSRTHGNLTWIRAQRKISRAKASGYFNLEILNSIRTIRKGITGLDPNAEEKPQLRRWLELHEKKRSGSRADAMQAKGAEAAREAKKKCLVANHHGNSAGQDLSRCPAALPYRRPAVLLHQTSEDPPNGVSAPLQNVSKPGGQGKNLCRNGVSQHPIRKGTGKPPSGRSRPKK